LKVIVPVFVDPEVDRLATDQDDLVGHFLAQAEEQRDNVYEIDRRERLVSAVGRGRSKAAKCPFSRRSFSADLVAEANARSSASRASCCRAGEPR
jgi:hypothetical protein